MKKILFILLLATITHLTMAQAFITTWQTDNPGISNDDQIRIPAIGTGTYTVQWEDLNNLSNSGNTTATGQTTITFPNVGTYRISITGDLTFFAFFNTGDSEKLRTIEQWGNIAWSSMGGSFWGCSNLTYNATDTPDLSGVADLSNMFNGCFVFNGDITGWDVSNVIFMRNTFRNAFAFNQNISGWNVSNVNTMEGMFAFARSFNQNIAGWNISNASTMKDMFNGATAFNQDISGWTVSNVNNMEGMFAGATSFDQNIGGWNISNVTTMVSMLDFSGLSTTNYDNTLIGWSTQAVQPSVVLTAEGLLFCNGQNPRQALIDAPNNWDISLDIFDCTALPVELTNFTAKQVTHGIHLDWQTESEINNSGFKIERSRNGTNWNTLDFVSGHGTSSRPQKYSYTDTQPLTGNNYYRLKQIDFDGQFEHSKILSIVPEIKIDEHLKIYPNPSSGAFTLSLYNPMRERILIRLFNSTGSLIWEEAFSDGELSVEWEKQFDLTKEGIYFFQTEVGNEVRMNKVSVID